jgi:hypothetical protein
MDADRRAEQHGTHAHPRTALSANQPSGAESSATRQYRERDELGRPANARPRDALGRPLPRGSEGAPRVDETVARTPEEALAEAQRLLDAGLPFHAHEVLEGAWKQAPDAERDLWQGLAQLAVGLTHARRGNHAGARTLLERGRARIAGYEGAAPHGIDVTSLMRWADESRRHESPVTPRLRRE